ncbi:beta-ketoacyl-ACP synthase [Arenimonas fontis]|uniref:Beta-ketoacyl-ACP synthase n=1 Tax=Arenimonas fontis TaxID=2608255 RepID=A0A5B2ZFI7_9GAMM|nr:beta-ketoacyl-ACP synthase [Arenimonas fontis]KAA2285954.1 beta-ketoacyl-ACP synthase [Arenimonas fontis]
MSAVFLRELGLACALGRHVDEVAAGLFAADRPRGLEISEACSPGRPMPLGWVPGGLDPLADWPLPLRGRNNALLALAAASLQDAVAAEAERFGAMRLGVVLGTSTSGVGESEQANIHRIATGRWPEDFHYRQQEMGTPARFLAELLGLRGPAHVISTACSSSAKALASAARLLQAGFCDAVVAGGADSLCRFTVAGFDSLGAVSDRRCNPFSRHRAGINIGEGAALFLLTRQEGPVRLAGWGESADAHHMSAPDPAGAGPEACIREALARAGRRPQEIDYVNLHGTATLQNDAMEAGVHHRIFGQDCPASSTKPMTGHTLGAAGAIEAAVAWLCLARNPQRRLPPHWWDGEADPALATVRLARPGETVSRLRRVLSQSFAFGGSNIALVLEAE